MVWTPGRTSSPAMRCAAATTLPASRISAISRGLFSSGVWLKMRRSTAGEVSQLYVWSHIDILVPSPGRSRSRFFINRERERPGCGVLHQPQRRRDLPVHVLDLAVGIDLGQQTRLPVVVHQPATVLVIHHQPLADRLLVVV